VTNHGTDRFSQLSPIRRIPGGTTESVICSEWNDRIDTVAHALEIEKHEDLAHIR